MRKKIRQQSPLKNSLFIASSAIKGIPSTPNSISEMGCKLEGYFDKDSK